MYILSTEQRDILRNVVGSTCDQIVWDINAVYFVARDIATKVEAVSDAPLEDDRTEEVLHLSVEVVRPAPSFSQPTEDGHWYQVIGRNLRVDRIELVRTAVILPGESITAPATAPPSAFVADCGVLVHTSRGILPAVQLENSFGFHNWGNEAPRCCSATDVMNQIGGAYERVALAAN